MIIEDVVQILDNYILAHNLIKNDACKKIVYSKTSYDYANLFDIECIEDHGKFHGKSYLGISIAINFESGVIYLNVNKKFLDLDGKHAKKHEFYLSVDGERVNTFVFNDIKSFQLALLDVDLNVNI